MKFDEVILLDNPGPRLLPSGVGAEGSGKVALHNEAADEHTACNTGMGEEQLDEVTFLHSEAAEEEETRDMADPFMMMSGMVAQDFDRVNPHSKAADDEEDCSIADPAEMMGGMGE